MGTELPKCQEAARPGHPEVHGWAYEVEMHTKYKDIFLDFKQPRSS